MADRIWAGHPGAGPDAPRRRAAGLAGHRHAGGAGADHRAAARASPARWARSPRASTAYYTGRLVGEMLHGPAKAHAVRALAAREGLDLRRCTAYSDSVNDVPMLSRGRAPPWPSTPTATLRDIARGPRLADPRLPHGPARDPIGVPLGCSARAPWRAPRWRAGLAAGAAPARRRTRSRLQPRKAAPRRRPSSRYSVCWMVSRTWSVRSNTSIGSSAASGP